MQEYFVTARVMLFKDNKRTKEYALDGKEYARLHAEMHARGYVRYVIDDFSQTMYRLPAGEYNLVIAASDAPPRAQKQSPAPRRRRQSRSRRSVTRRM